MQDKESTINQDKTMYEYIDDWLKDYREAKNEQERINARALIVTRMMPVVKRIARQIARRNYDPIDDFIQVGAVGLMKAINCYNPEKGSNFRSYAGAYIIGEIRHYIRDQLYAVRLPAHVQELSTRVNSFIANLTTQEFNDLTNEYVAQNLNLDKDNVDLIQIIDKRKYTLSLDVLHVKEVDRSQQSNLKLNYEKEKRKAKLEDAKLIIQLVIVRLPKEYRKIVELYYERDYNRKEIAETLGISEMQVGRQLNKAFELLHEMIVDSQLGNSLMELFE